MRRPDLRGIAASRVLPAALCMLLTLLPAMAAQARIIGINHTHWAINHFSIDGHSGLDIIGPWQGGGGGYYSLPPQWRPEMTVKVNWETGASGISDLADEFPGYTDWPRYLDWVEKVDAQKRQHSKVALVPEYGNEDVCGITVHFLPCDDIQVTTSCAGYGHSDYPIKTPLKLPVPPSCPATAEASTQGSSR